MAIVSLGVSCEKEDVTLEDNNVELMTITAGIEQQTKTSLDGFNVKWTTNNKIQVFGFEDLTGSVFTLTKGAGTLTGTFTGVSAEPERAKFALYPSTMFDEYASREREITFTLPAEQGYKAGGFADDVNPMTAVEPTAESGILPFKNICGILHLQLTGDKVLTGIKVTSSTTNLSGKATVIVAQTSGEIAEIADPAIVMDTYDGASVTLDCSNESGSGVTLTEDAQSFYIVLPPVAGNTLTITLVAGGVSYTKAIGGNTTIVRNEITNMPSLVDTDFTPRKTMAITKTSGTTISPDVNTTSLTITGDALEGTATASSFTEDYAYLQTMTALETLDLSGIAGTEIIADAFREMPALKSFKAPNGVTKLGDNAFE